MDEITSVKNPLIKLLKDLARKSVREESGLFLVEGEVMIGEALKSGLTIREAIAVPEKVELLQKLPVQSHIVPDGVLQAVCDTKTPQGICAAFELPSPTPFHGLPDQIVALDGVQDPGNVGTIWRTADAAGFQAMLFGDGCADPMSPKVQRSAMGSSFRIPFSQADNLAEALDALRTRGYEIICSALDGDDFYTRSTGSERFVLVIGSEARGISNAVRDGATMVLKLPMRGGAESLNAAVAAGIMMYELMKDVPNRDLNP